MIVVCFAWLRLLAFVKMIGVNRMDIMLKIKLSSQSKFLR